MKINLIPAELYCRNCDKFVKPASDPDDDRPVMDREHWCPRCNEHFECDECGAEVDRKGRCTDPTRHLPPEGTS